MIPSRVRRRWLASVSCACVGWVGAPTLATGQVVLGRVIEQLSLSPVGGASVRLVDEATGAEVPVGAWTDALGTFVVHAPAEGRYRLQAHRDGLSSPLSEMVEAGSPDTVEVTLVLPSSLLRAALPCQSGDAARAAVVGRVLDARSGVALPGAAVSASWTEGGVRRFADAVADASGTYAVCLPPGPSPVAFETDALGVRQTHGSLTVDRPAIVVHDLVFDLSPVAIEIDGLEVTARAAAQDAERITPFRRGIVAGASMAAEEVRGARAFETLRRSAPGVRITEWHREGSPPVLCIQTNRRIQSLRRSEEPGFPGDTPHCEGAQVVVDGVRIPDGAEFLLRTPSSELESIEFVTPVQAQILYGIGGDTAGGVVVVYTRGKGPYATPARNR